MKFLFPEHQRKWLLWILDATDREKTELDVIHRILQRYSSFTVPIREITRGGIDFRSSSLVKKLLKQGFLRIGKSEFELHQRYLNNHSELVKDLTEYYSSLHKAKTSIETPFPTSGFSIIPDDALKIPAEEFPAAGTGSEKKSEDILEVSFKKNILPPILLHADYIQEFPFLCWRKLRHYLSLFAGDNSDFYSEKIQSYKNLIIGRPRELLENELGQIQRRTEKDYREESTRLIFDRIIASKDANRQVLSDLISPENSYILTRYTSNAVEDFDVLQSLTMLEMIYFNKEKRRRISPDDFLNTLRETIALCVSVPELKQMVRENFPDVKDEDLAAAYESFIGTCVGTGSERREVLGFSAPGKGDHLIHRENIEAYLDARGVRLQGRLRDKIEKKWIALIEQHQFEEAMFSDKAFRELIHKLMMSEQPTTSSLLRSSALYEFLAHLQIRSEFVDRLRTHAYGQPDRVFELNRETLYAEAYRTVYSRYAWFGSLIFRILHWIARSVFTNQPRNSEKPKKNSAEKSSRGNSEQDILSQAGLPSRNEAAEALQELWNRLPVDILPRDEIDRNIQTDLNSFYGERQEVALGALSVITDRNIRRVLQKAPHLEGYSQGLREYIDTKIMVLISLRSDLRGKTRL